MIEKTKQWNFMKTIPNLVSTLRYVAHGILAGLLLVIEISSNIAFSICIYLNSDNTPLTKYRFRVYHKKKKFQYFLIKFFDRILVLLKSCLLNTIRSNDDAHTHYLLTMYFSKLHRLSPIWVHAYKLKLWMNWPFA